MKEEMEGLAIEIPEYLFFCFEMSTSQTMPVFIVHNFPESWKAFPKLDLEFNKNNSAMMKVWRDGSKFRTVCTYLAVVPVGVDGSC